VSAARLLGQHLRHHHEAEQVQAEVLGDGLRHDRLAQPVQVGLPSLVGQLVAPPRAAVPGLRQTPSGVVANRRLSS
jgi:hypothetical protein